MEEAEQETDLEFTNLKQLIDDLPKTVKALKNTVEEMTASAGPGDDYSEKKEELAEQLEELDEIEQLLDKYEENFNVIKE